MLKRLAVGIGALALGVAAATTLVSDTSTQQVDDRTIFCTEFVPNVEGSNPYTKWARSAPADRDRWIAFRTGICNSQEPLPPDMVTLFGKALVAVGKMALPEPEPPPTTTTTTTTTTTDTTTTTEPPPPPVTTGAFPRSFHIWGGPIQTIMTTHDLVVTLNYKADPIAARAVNPGLVVLGNSTVAQETCPNVRSFAFTYGGGLAGSNVECGSIGPWPGANDTYEPFPQGTIRAFNPGPNPGVTGSGDYGCKQADGLTGFAIYNSSTMDFIRKASFYGWKKYSAKSRGWNGVWSDNWIPPNLIYAGWFYGARDASGNWLSNCSPVPGTRTNGTPTVVVTADMWAAAFTGIPNQLRSWGVPLIGGNGCFRTGIPGNETWMKANDVCLHEVLESTIAQGPSSYATLLGEMIPWQKAATGRPRYAACMDKRPSTDTAGMRFALALATIAGCAYMPYQSHSDYYLPAEMKKNGQRHYLGLPTGDPVRSGNTWSRTFEGGTVTANYDTKTATWP